MRNTILWIIKIAQLGGDALLIVVLVLSVEPGQKLLAFTVGTIITVGGSLALDIFGRSLPAAHPLQDPFERFLNGIWDPYVSIVLGIVVLVLMYVPFGLPGMAILVAAWIFVVYELLTDVLTAVFVR